MRAAQRIPLHTLVLSLVLGIPAICSASPSGSYIVSRGDSLWTVAARLKTTVSALADTNGLRPGCVLSVGQRLTVPSRVSAAPPATAAPSPNTWRTPPYVVGKGDSLWTVATKFHTSVSMLAQLNGLKQSRMLTVGQKLAIPGGGLRPTSRGRVVPRPYQAPERPGSGSLLTRHAPSPGVRATLVSRIQSLRVAQVVGTALQQLVQARADGIAPLNRPYIFNGVQDCYGFVRQVWDPILIDGSAHAEDFSSTYTWESKRNRVQCEGGLPIDTAPDSNWVRIDDPKALFIGDIVATDMGHHWGPRWHGGIYAGLDGQGNPMDWDCSASRNGAYKRSFVSIFRYYYMPIHELLDPARSSSPPATAAPATSTPALATAAPLAVQVQIPGAAASSSEATAPTTEAPIAGPVDPVDPAAPASLPPGPHLDPSPSAGPAQAAPTAAPQT